MSSRADDLKFRDDLAEKLGADLAERILERMPMTPAHDLATKDDIAELRGELRSGLAELRGELHQEIGSVRQEIGGVRGEIGGVRGEIGELRGEIGELRGELSDTLQRHLLHVTMWNSGVMVAALGLALGVSHVG